eukprot:7199854-Prymnesium_polylepis.2
MSVMHHAADKSVSLLQQAATHFTEAHLHRRRHSDVGSNHHALRVNDPRGHFRTDNEWKQLFSVHPRVSAAEFWSCFRVQ